VQTAEGALNETTSILQRMRDLSVQASSTGSLNDDAKSSIQKEIGQLKSELTRISNTTTFNGTKLLDGSYKGTFQVGANAGETIDVNVTQAMDADSLGVGDVDVTAGGATFTSDPGTFDFAATTAPTDPDLTYNGNTYTLDLSDWDTGGTSDAAAKNQALVQNQFDKHLNGSGLTAKVDSYGGLTISGPSGLATGDVTSTALTALTFNAAGSTSGGSAAITAIDAAIKTVSAQRADLGAIQNRFEHTVNNLNVSIENTTASESRIRDTDMASEMTNFTRAQVLTQAGTSMLAQANQSTQSILKLLG
jgi:flagellin